MRTQDEIVAFLGKTSMTAGLVWIDHWDALAVYLDYEHARPFLKPEVTQEEWDKFRLPLTEESVIGRMREYMRHAWEKVEGHRGISASVAVEKFRLWLWLLGDDELYEFASDERNYAPYGAPILAVICRKYGFPIPESEAISRMARGEPCSPKCKKCFAL